VHSKAKTNTKKKKAADIRSKEQLYAMSSEDLKRTQIPLTVRTERGEDKEAKTDQMKPDEAEAAAAATADKGPEKKFQNFSAAVAAKEEGLEKKSIKELREMCKALILRKVRSIVIIFGKYTKPLTFEDLWKEQGPRLLVVRRQE